MALMQVLKMTLGELDYNTVMVDSLDQTNEDTKAPLLPYRESSTIFMAIFIFAMPIILTNLLVSNSAVTIERFSIECRETNTKVFGITAGVKSAMNQSKFEVIACNVLKARQKSRVQGAIEFGFPSHWLINWGEIFKPITKRINCDCVITFDSPLKTALMQQY